MTRLAATAWGRWRWWSSRSARLQGEHRRQVEQFSRALLDPASWISRRVEAISYEGSGETRRSVSLDFTLPDDYCVSDHPGTVLVPLAMLRKGPLTRLDVRDAAGSALPVLETGSNAAWATEAVLDYLEGQFVLTEPQRQLVSEIVAASPEDATGLSERLIGQLPSFPPDDLTKALAVEFLRELGTSFAFVTELPASVVGRRTVVKFAYEQSSDPDLPWHAALINSLKPATAVVINSPAVSEAASYHLELRPPASVSASSLEITRSSDTTETWESRARGPIAHLNVRDDSAGGSYEGRAVLRPRRSGLVTFAWVASLVVLGLVVLASGYSGLVAGKLTDSAVGSTGATTLLVVPAFLLALLARPLEHPTASRVYFPPRLVAALTAGTLLLAATLAVLKLSDDEVKQWALGLMAWQAVIAVYASVLMALSDPRRTVKATS